MLRNSIMRRVYTAFLARVLSHPVLLYSALLIVSLVTFAHLVHVRKVVESFFSVPLHSIDDLIINALLRAEIVTIISLSGMVVATILLQRHLWRYRPAATTMVRSTV